MRFISEHSFSVAGGSKTGQVVRIRWDPAISPAIKGLLSWRHGASGTCPSDALGRRVHRHLRRLWYIAGATFVLTVLVILAMPTLLPDVQETWPLVSSRHLTSDHTWDREMGTPLHTDTGAVSHGPVFSPLVLHLDDAGCPAYRPPLRSSVEVLSLWNESFNLPATLHHAGQDTLMDEIEFAALWKSMGRGLLHQMSHAALSLPGATLRLARVVDYLDPAKVRRSFVAISAECHEHAEEEEGEQEGACGGGLRKWVGRPTLLPIDAPYTAKEAGPEDGRIFMSENMSNASAKTHRGGGLVEVLETGPLGGSPVLIFNMAEGDGRRRMWVYDLLRGKLTRLDLKIADTEEGEQGKRVEKNWTPIRLVGPTLELVYRFHPLQIVRCHLDRDGACEPLQGFSATDTDFQVAKPDDPVISEEGGVRMERGRKRGLALKVRQPRGRGEVPIMRGGTPFIRLPQTAHGGEFYMAFARSQVMHDGCCPGNRGFYRPHVVIMERTVQGKYEMLYASEPLDFRDAIWRFSRKLRAGKVPARGEADGCEGIQRILIPMSIVKADEERDLTQVSFSVDDSLNVVLQLKGLLAFAGRVIATHRGVEGSLTAKDIVGCAEEQMQAYCGSDERPWRKGPY